MHCFAGQEDELVVSSESTEHSLSIWSLPADRQFTDRVINQPLVVLKSHKVSFVCYSHRTETLASAGEDRIIKLRTPIAQE